MTIKGGTSRSNKQNHAETGRLNQSRHRDQHHDRHRAEEGHDEEKSYLLGTTDDYFRSFGAIGDEREISSNIQQHHTYNYEPYSYSHEGPIKNTVNDGCRQSSFCMCCLLILFALGIGIWAIFDRVETGTEAGGANSAGSNQAGILLATFQPNYQDPTGQFSFVVGNAFLAMVSIFLIVPAVAQCSNSRQSNMCASLVLFCFGIAFLCPALYSLDFYPKEFEIRLLPTDPYSEYLEQEQRGRNNDYGWQDELDGRRQQKVLTLRVPTLIGPTKLYTNIQRVSYINRKCSPLYDNDVVKWDYFRATEPESDRKSVLVTVEACPTRLGLTNIDVFWNSPCSVCFNPSNHSEFLSYVQEQIAGLGN
mmetsp:Transcript_16066/g.23752  ORF Transcript_16066/g.23752 Transcript_16066/m.23752 type:complete len:363 (+) Transcript_16066:249-1337(+)